MFITKFYFLCIASTKSLNPVTADRLVPVEIKVDFQEKVIEEHPDNAPDDEGIETAIEDFIEEQTPVIPNLAPPAGVELQDYKNKRNRYQKATNSSSIRLTLSLKLEPVPSDFFANKQDWSSVKKDLDIFKVQSLFAPLADLTIAEASEKYFLPIKNARDRFFVDNPLKGNENIPHFRPYAVRPTKNPDVILAAAMKESELCGQQSNFSLHKFDFLKTKYNKEKALQGFLNNTFTKSNALETLTVCEKSGFISYRVVLRVIIFEITPFIKKTIFQILQFVTYILVMIRLIIYMPVPSLNVLLLPQLIIF